jgi:hypothetical protein
MDKIHPLCYAFEASHRERAKVLKHAECNDPNVIAPPLFEWQRPFLNSNEVLPVAQGLLAQGFLLKGLLVNRRQDRCQ